MTGEDVEKKNQGSADADMKRTLVDQVEDGTSIA